MAETHTHLDNSVTLIVVSDFLIGHMELLLLDHF